MFPMDIASSGNQQMVYRNNQGAPQHPQHGAMPPHHQQQQQQMPSQQHSSPQQQQQQQQHPQQHQHQHPPQHQQQQQQHVFPSQYGYPQQQQQQQQYLAYPNTAANSGAAKPAMSFMPQQSYMPPQQVFPYGYPQPQPQPQSQPQPQPQHFFPQPMPLQSAPPPPPQTMRYHQQGGSNSTNHFVGGPMGTQRYNNVRGRGRGGAHGAYNAQFHRQLHNSYYYNQQHHYSSNNAVPEKTPTVHLLHPDPKRIISVKLNRIYSTMADIRPQLQHHQPQSNSTSVSNNTSVTDDGKAEKSISTDKSKEKSNTPAVTRFDPKTTKLVLCTSFLSTQGCMHGSGCDKVHIAGLEYTWQQVEPSEVEKDGKRAYAAGFFVHCYDPTLTRYYKVPSESVHVTKGSIDYVGMFNDHGDNFKMKFKLCAAVLSHAECEKGEDCEDIHCSVSDLESVRENSANATHINNPEAMAEVPRLPAEMTVRVFNQNSFDTYHDYPGGNVLMTDGAKTYQKQYEQEMNSIPTRKRMQHCAHFRLKDMCRLGESCRFLHVLPTEQEIKERKEAEAAEAAAKEAAAKEAAAKEAAAKEAAAKEAAAEEAAAKDAAAAEPADTAAANDVAAVESPAAASTGAGSTPATPPNSDAKSDEDAKPDTTAE